MMLLDPKEITIEDRTGTPRVYRIGRLPYLAGGREIGSQYISTALPKVGNYPENEGLASKMLSHVAAVLEDGSEQRLLTPELVNNHVPDFITGIKLEAEALEHNVGFSVTGKLREFHQQWQEDLPTLVIKTLTQLRDCSPPTTKPASTSSEPNTH